MPTWQAGGPRYAAVSPSLGPCCAEFRHFREEFPPEFRQYQVRPDYFDLWRLSLDQLQARYETGRISDRFQVDLPRQALYQAQISLLSSATTSQGSSMIVALSSQEPRS